ncbi:6010_t:CDS:2 [Scutellospora calospora]|uniref:6010_t:CDS:1 n=1 Tax=Scutellospora calospora TaxID=85575 RepID=A0ACA9JU31_9GLOM|nr:6010_t:CDS:2 [Scutellospora calospora]
MTSQDSDIENLDQNNKNLGGRPCAPIWSFFTEGEEIDSGHRSVTCECDGQFLRISITAAAVWQQMMKTGHIIKLRDYHVRKSPYNATYISNVDSPQIWWETCEPNLPYLQLLAIKLFSVSPHAANCECVWSTCGWIYGKRRISLSVKNLDAIAQIRSYYIANSKSELPHYGIDKSAEDIKKILYNTDLYEEINDIALEQAIMNVNINQSSIDNDYDIISEEFFELEDALDLSNLTFLPEESKQIDADIVDDDAGSSDWLEEFNQEEDYDPAELGEMFLN